MDVNLQQAAVAAGAVLSVGGRTPRIMQDLVDGRLDADEATSIADWLTTTCSEDAPARIVDRAVCSVKASCNGPRRTPLPAPSQSNRDD